MRLLDEIKEATVPIVHFDDAPAAGEGGPLTGLRHQFRQPNQVIGGSCKSEGPTDAAGLALIQPSARGSIMQRRNPSGVAACLGPAGIYQ